MRAIRVNDLVQVQTGADQKKRGKVIRVYSDEERILVEGIHVAYQHVRKSRKNPQGGGRLEREMPVHVSNVLLVCPHCDKPTRTDRQVVEADGRRDRVRACRRCGKPIR